MRDNLIINKNMNLKVTSREIFGKKLNSSRLNGLIPGILYGEKLKPIAIFVNNKELKNVYKKVGTTNVIDLFMQELTNNEKKYQVLVKAIQINPATEEILHVDLYQIPTHKITLKVPLVFTGKSDAESQGAILIKNYKALTLTGLMNQIPNQIIVDISSVKNIGNEIKIKDITFSEDVEVKENKNEVVVFALQAKQESLETSQKQEAASPLSDDDTDVSAKQKQEAKGNEKKTEEAGKK